MNLAKDLKIETVRSSDGYATAARVTHVWTGISATVGTQRSTGGNVRVATAMVAEGLALIGYKEVRRG